MTETKDQTRTAGVEMQDGASKGQLTAPGGGRPTRAQEVEAARSNMLADVEANKGEITRFLSAFGIDYEFFAAGLRIFLMRQVQNQPDFFSSVTPTSFMEALFRCAKDGLIPDGKESAIGHFKGVATYLPMRDGFVKVLWRTGMIKDINDQTVTAQEDALGRFDYEEGDQGYIRHKPMMERKDTDEVVAAYCVINLVGGGSIREVVPKFELDKIARMSRSPARKEWASQMHRKAAIRRAMGKMPREKGIAQVLHHDEANYDLLAAEARPEGAITAKNLFANRAAVRRRQPMETANARPDDANDGPPAPAADQELAGQGATPQGDGAGTADAGEAATHDQSALSAAIADIRGAADLTALLEATQVALALAQDGDETEWVNEATAARKADLLPAEPFALTAVISSASGPKVYEDADLWRDDLLNKMAALKGDALMVFWKRNLAFIIEAGEAGFDEQATRLLDVAAEKRLPTEMPS